MRAAVYQGNQQFAIKELADPAPAPGQVVVDVEFCAICGTDVHAVMYDIAPVGSVLGHEYSGVISRVGPGVDRWRHRCQRPQHIDRGRGAIYRRTRSADQLPRNQ